MTTVSGGITATIIADSVSAVNGKRITTFELEYHRYVHAEFMTHRMFSRNAASSRAIPVKRMLEQVANNPATPTHWGQNQSGMQASGELSKVLQASCLYTWKKAAAMASTFAGILHSTGLHKQVANRITEPFQMMKVVVTATEWENFFWLRDHEMAQPEIAELARCMREAMEQSTPETLYTGEWHVPYVKSSRFGGELRYYVESVWTGEPKLSTPDFFQNCTRYHLLTLEEALEVSASCCAGVSYRKNNSSVEKAKEVYDKLLSGDRKHASPFEHQATPINASHNPHGEVGFHTNLNSLWDGGVTHIDKDGNLWSGNLCGWIQHRQLIEENVKRG